MKKIFCALFLALVCFGHVWAGGAKFYSEGKAAIYPSSNGKGTVYAGNSTPGAGTTYSTTSSYTSISGTKQEYTTYYFAAKPIDGYSFAGWYDEEGWLVSTANPYQRVIQSPTSRTSGDATLSRTFRAKFLPSPVAVDVTYESTTGGSYKVQYDGGTAETVSTKSNTKNNAAIVTLTATANTGYAFYRWYTIQEGAKKYLSAENPLRTTFTSSTTIGAEFASTSDLQPALFIRQSNPSIIYESLSSAIEGAAADETIVLVASGIVNEDVTIPSGMTLLIPFNEEHTCYTTKPSMPTGWQRQVDRKTAPASGNNDANLTAKGSANEICYRKLTLAEGKKLTINGTLSLSAPRWVITYSQWYGGIVRIFKYYGCIDMQNNSKIVVNDKGKLYCWGKIIGKGEVVAEKGAEIRECCVIGDIRDTDVLFNTVRSSTCFPFSQIFVQDILVPITMKAGSSEILFMGLSLYSGEDAQTGDVKWVGTTDDNLFYVKDTAYLKRTYDATTDRMTYDLYGGASLGNTAITIQKGSFGTSGKVFCMNNSWTINFKSGESTIGLDLSLSASAQVNIENKAKVKLVEKKSIFVYDKNEWGTFAAGNKITPYLDSKRTADGLASAVLKVDGELKIIGGTSALKSKTNAGLFTTNSKANICSSNDGATIIFSNATGTVPSLLQYTKGYTDEASTSVAVTAAYLKNADGNYVQSTGSSTFKYIKRDDNGFWGKEVVVKFVDGEKEIRTVKKVSGDTLSAPTDLLKTGYEFKGWGAEFPVTVGSNDITYTAQWTANTNTPYTVKHYQENLENNQYTLFETENLSGTTDATVTPSVKDYEGFTAPEVSSLTIAGDGSSVKEYNYMRKAYAVSATGDNGSVSGTGTYKYGANVTLTATANDGYHFEKWSDETTTPSRSFTATADASFTAIFVQDITEVDPIVVETEHTKVVENKQIVTNSVTIQQEGTLDIASGSTVTTTTLSLSATPSDVNVLDGNYAGTSSQIKGKGAISATNAYIDIQMDKSGKLNGSLYYAFAVPFNVNVNGGVQKNINGALAPAVLDKDFRAYTYNGANRAKNGKGSNWDMVDANGTFTPGVFYLVEFADGSCNTFRFTKAAGNENKLNNADTIHVNAYTSTETNSTNWGWNGIANNALQSAHVTTAEGVAQVFDPAKKAFVPVNNLGETFFSIGTPLMVQVGKSGVANNSAVQASSSAPARMLAQTDDKTYGNYTVRIKAEGAAKTADQLFISASEDAKSEYVIGKDLTKMFMGNATVAQLWVNDYSLKLAMNQAILVDNTAEASLTLYAPKAGNYTVYLKDIPEDATIYLLEKGDAIADLNDGAFTVALDKGENTQYGLRINTKTIPGVITSMDEALVSGKVAQKVLIDGVVYIVRDGKLYNMFGQQR